MFFAFDFHILYRQEREEVGSGQSEMAILWKIRKRYTSPHRFPHTVHHFVMAHKNPTRSTKLPLATRARATCEGTSQPGFWVFLDLASLFTSARSLWLQTPSAPPVISRARAFARASPYSKMQTDSVFLLYTGTLRKMSCIFFYAQLTTNMRYSII